MPNYALTPEQKMLKDSLGAYLRDAPKGPTRWRAFAHELAILGVSIPERAGGLGGGSVDTAVVMEELGWASADEPFVETVVVCGALLARARSAFADEALRQLINGGAQIALAHNEVDAGYNPASVATTARRVQGGYVLNGFKAVVSPCVETQRLIVSARTSSIQRSQDGISLFLIDATAEGLSRRAYRTIDERSAADVTLVDVFVADQQTLGHLDSGFALLEPALDAATAAVCAEGVGCMRAMLQQTIEYVKQRRQFDKPLSSLQVVRHALVDAFVAIEQSAAITHHAALVIDAGSDSRCAVSAAKVHVSAALRLVSQTAVQLHGAIGTTQELPLSSYFKRATAIQSQFGSRDHHIKRYLAASPNMPVA